VGATPENAVSQELANNARARKLRGYLQKNSMTCDVVIVFPIPKRVLARKAGL